MDRTCRRRAEVGAGGLDEPRAAPAGLGRLVVRRQQRGRLSFADALHEGRLGRWPTASSPSRPAADAAVRRPPCPPPDGVPPDRARPPNGRAAAPAGCPGPHADPRRRPLARPPPPDAATHPLRSARASRCAPSTQPLHPAGPARRSCSHLLLTTPAPSVAPPLVQVSLVAIRCTRPPHPSFDASRSARLSCRPTRRCRLLRGADLHDPGFVRPRYDLAPTACRHPRPVGHADRLARPDRQDRAAARDAAVGDQRGRVSVRAGAAPGRLPRGPADHRRGHRPRPARRRAARALGRADAAAQHPARIGAVHGGHGRVRGADAGVPAEAARRRRGGRPAACEQVPDRTDLQHRATPAVGCCGRCSPGTA